MDVDRGRLASLGVDVVLLFGSRARGTAHLSSDTDVAVRFAPGVDPDFGRREDVRSALGTSEDVDLVVLNGAAPLLLREVAIDGQVVFESAPGAAEDFRLWAHKMYMDTAWMRRLDEEALRRRT